ncbi:TPA: hypothetical protein R9131_000324 [Campylobacter upsaliensis]|nr:hypothetical protein [Campylobacter upsaliensis]HEF3568474.1 hypothetical protein [Campylobacter upsaliensis]
MSKAKKLHKKLNLTPFLCGGGAGSSRVKRVAEANSPEAARQIYAKWQGKFKPKSQAKKAFFKS